ncbi:serine/threonine protein kinase, putative [Entamoeba histolytica HM-1:IMSS-B]|nr:serine/threonine protein kinase, putative [Entamoeba histolytica HM-1:IMSS-B]ENY60744.1 serine/threonine protein kinase, putative [Entamoeba histolytica HM-1:IMSS-A]
MREVRTFTARKSTEDDWGEYFIIPNEGINIGKINENNTDNEYKSICLEDIDLLESEDDERKEEFIKQMKEIGKMIEIGSKDNNNKIFQILLQLHNIVLNINLKQLQACIHIIGLFPLFAILEKEEYSGCLQLRLTSLQIINTILAKDNTSKMNIVMSGCATIVKFGITHYKSNDLYLNEIVKFIKCIINNETNKNELQQMFITSGGLELIYLILTMKYDDKHKGNMNVVLEIVNRIVQSQRDIKTRMEFCSRNITTMIFIQYKLIDGLLEFICQTFSLKQYTPALKAITIIILIIDSIMRNDTQIKFIVCQRIISTDLIGILSRTMDTSINSKLNEFIQEDVLFNVCKLCKLLISDTEKEIIYGLFNTKLIFFIVKVLLRCDSLDKELKNCCLINMMKNGLINNVIQCLNILCTSSIIGPKVCLELSSIPNIFLLLKSYCDKGKSNFVMVEEDCLNIILTIAGSITKQQSSSDFILHNALEFLLEYCSKKGIVAHLFSAFSALYQARPKKGLKILGDVKSIVLICNIFNLSNYNDGMCCSELKEFCAIINEHEELIKLYSESTFVYGTASLLRQVVNIEAKKYFAVLMKSLLLNNTHLYNLIMKDKIIIYLNETYTECMENGKEVVGKIVEECLSFVMNANPKRISKKEEQKIIEKLKKEEELKQKLKKENDKFLHQKKENRKVVSFGKPGSNQMLEKALSGEFIEESKQKRSASFTPTQKDKNEDLHLSFPVKAIPHLASHSQPSTPSQKSSRKLFSFGKKEEKY